MHVPSLLDPRTLAAIYARVSSEDQARGYSIPTQIEACQALAEREGYVVPPSHVFVDDGISGTTLDRPALRRLRDLVVAQAIAAVIVLDPDRLGRKMGKLLVLTEELQAANIALRCVSHPVEHGPEGVLFFQMRGVIAEYEREKALERMLRGKRGRVKHGYFAGGTIPYGYTYIPEAHKGTFVIHEEEAAVVRRIFALYCAGTSMRAIAVQLTREGVPPKRAKAVSPGRATGRTRWEVSSIHSILHNAAYTGTMFWNKRRRIGTKYVETRDRSEWFAIPMPVIIPPDVFAAAQHQSQQQAHSSRRNRKYEYLFTGGRLRCGRCGASMVGYSVRHTLYYRCASQYRHHPDEPFCRGNVRADHIEPRVWHEVEQFLLDPAKVMAELERRELQGAEAQGDMTKERQAIQKALAGLERETQRWDQAYAEEAIELAEWRAKREDITERKQRFLDQQEAVEAAIQSAQEAQATTRDILTYCLQVREQLSTYDMPRKRRALDALNLTVTWSPGEPLVIDGSVPVTIASVTSCRHE